MLLAGSAPSQSALHAGAKPNFKKKKKSLVRRLGTQDAPWEEFVFVLMPKTFAGKQDLGCLGIDQLLLLSPPPPLKCQSHICHRRGSNPGGGHDLPQGMWVWGRPEGDGGPWPKNLHGRQRFLRACGETKWMHLRRLKRGLHLQGHNPRQRQRPRHLLWRGGG